MFRAWVRLIKRSLDAGQAAHGPLVWGIAVAVPVFLAGVIHAVLLQYSLILTFAWAVVVLYFTLGFRQFSHHFTQIRQALELGDEPAARMALATWKRVPTETIPSVGLVRHVLAHAAMAAHRHVLGVLVCFVFFWALGLGPVGAVLYRLADYFSASCRSTSHELSSSPSVQTAATQAWHWINHGPSRATALAFAVVGNFEEAIASWRQDAATFRDSNDGVVLAATAGALNIRFGDRTISPRPVTTEEAMNSTIGFHSSAQANVSGREPQLGHLASLVGLVWRGVVLWMLLLALLTLARLLEEDPSCRLLLFC
jgi:adenosylcobinamide-phosphate synthase